LKRMIADRAVGAEWGRNARSMLNAHYSRTQALDRWSQLIRSLDQDSPKATV
jgi:hypothetical protein